MILAMVAAGHNPRHVGNAGLDLVHRLEVQDKSGYIYGFGDTRAEAFGLLAEVASGTPVDAGAAARLRAMQNPDGSWNEGVAAGAPGDTNATAMAVMALMAAEHTVPMQAHLLAYLHVAQNPDGGFPEHKPAANGDSNSNPRTDGVLIQARCSPPGQGARLEQAARPLPARQPAVLPERLWWLSLRGGGSAARPRGFDDSTLAHGPGAPASSYPAAATLAAPRPSGAAAPPGCAPAPASNGGLRCIAAGLPADRRRRVGCGPDHRPHPPGAPHHPVGCSLVGCSLVGCSPASQSAPAVTWDARGGVDGADLATRGVAPAGLGRSVTGRPLALWSGSAIGLSLLSTNPLPRALILLAALNICLAGRRPDRALRPLVIGVAVASVGAIAGNTLLSHAGADVLVTIPRLIPAIGGPLTVEGLLFGVGVALGLAAALFAAAPLGLALEAHELIAVLPRWLERTGTALATALTLVPALGTSFTAVRDSQRLRGWEPRGARSWLAVLTPVAVGSMERSLRVAEAMEARGYASGPRTSLPRPATPRSDRLISAGSVTALLVGIAARATGHNPDWLGYPRPAVPSLDPLALLGPGLLLLPALVLLLQWRSPTSPG